MGWNSLILMLRTVMIILTIILFANIAIAQKVLVNKDNGIALSGYDPVAFFTDKKPILGKLEIKSVNKNAICFHQKIIREMAGIG